MLRTRFSRSWRVATFIVVSTAPAWASMYSQINLVSDVPGLASNTDANLQNPWGMSSSAGSPIWVSNAGTSTSTLYNTSGTPQPLVVTIPPPSGGNFAGPTGQVFNAAGSGFNVNGQSSRFLFSTLSGTIAGWNQASGTTAAIGFDNSANAVYTGLAMGNTSAGDFLYAANFASGDIDVIDSTFAAVSLAGAFTDPTLPSGYSPFNIQNIGGELFVMYALVDPITHEETKGPGLGYVNVFDTNGNFVRRFTSQGVLNAPWGIAKAPAAGFGEFSGAVLIGNFGDGTINAFDAATGEALGVLTGAGGIPITNDGLWGLRFGNGGNGGLTTSLYFAAGIDDENHGLFGSIQAVPEPGTFGLISLAAIGMLATIYRRK
jgi:uncharacterized protein (TIGR03118 family)